MTTPPHLNQLTAEQLRQLAVQLLAETAEKDQTIAHQKHQLKHHQLLNDKLTHELAILKRHRFGTRSEVLNSHQASLLDDLVDADLAAIEVTLSEPVVSVGAAPAPAKRQPKRVPLPPTLPRTIITHEPDNTQCACGCQRQRIGEDISEKLDYTPGTFTVERHVRGKWVCQHCERLTQAPVPAQIIDKGLPTSLIIIRWKTRSGPLGRANWLFAGSLRSGQRAAAIMSLLQSARLNGHDPYAYLKDVLQRLPTQKNNAIDELLPHRWKPHTV